MATAAISAASAAGWSVPAATRVRAQLLLQRFATTACDYSDPERCFFVTLDGVGVYPLTTFCFAPELGREPLWTDCCAAAACVGAVLTRCSAATVAQSRVFRQRATSLRFGLRTHDDLVRILRSLLKTAARPASAGATRAAPPPLGREASSGGTELGADAADALELAYVGLVLRGADTTKQWYRVLAREADAAVEALARGRGGLVDAAATVVCAAADLAGGVPGGRVRGELYRVRGTRGWCVLAASTPSRLLAVAVAAAAQAADTSAAAAPLGVCGNCGGREHALAGRPCSLLAGCGPALAAALAVCD